MFPEEPDDEVGGRKHDIEARHEGEDVAHPDAVHLRVRDRHDVVVVDALRIEGALDHLVPLAGGEGVLAGVAVLRRTDPDDDLVVRLQDPPNRREMAPVERLEPPDEEGSPAHSSSSPRKWSMYGHSSVRNLRQCTQRPSSCPGAKAGFGS